MIFEHTETGLRVHAMLQRDMIECTSRTGEQEIVLTGYRLITDGGQWAVPGDSGDPEMRVVLVTVSSGDLIRLIRVS